MSHGVLVLVTQVVTTAQDKLPEHFTISAAGVVHVQPNEPSEFIPLAEWMHQSTAFNILRKIPYFKHYLTAKTFRLWRSNVRYSLYCQQRRKLAHNLFLARNSFCEPLVRISKVHSARAFPNAHGSLSARSQTMHELRQVSLLNVKPQQIYQDAAFVADQAEQRRLAEKSMQEIVERLETVVGNVCHEVGHRPALAGCHGG